MMLSPSVLPTLPHYSLTQSTKAERQGFLDKSVSAEEKAGDSSYKHFRGTYCVLIAVPGTDVYKTGNLLALLEPTVYTPP